MIDNEDNSDSDDDDDDKDEDEDEDEDEGDDEGEQTDDLKSVDSDPAVKSLWLWIEEGQRRGFQFLFVVDRGFRDVVAHWEQNYNITVVLPLSPSKGESQLSPSRANMSRMVTKVRWVVESQHARLKHFKIFYNKQPNSLIGKEHNLLTIIS